MGRMTTASMLLKMATLAPMPMARVMTAASVYPGDFLNCRAAYIKS